jgi:beta-glucanase (GH16 family)
VKKNMMRKKLVLFLAIISFSCSSGGDDPSPIPIVEPQVIAPVEGCKGGRIENASPNGDRTTLVWAEEFNEDGAPCVKNWNHETIPPNNGSWWNEEVQYYTDRRENSIVEDGVLKIIARKENYISKEYTSARMTTQRLFEFRYGKVEIKAKLPEGQGTWPALWFLGANIDTVGWPTCGEIDLMEHGDGEPGLVSSTVHRANADGNNYYRRGEQVIENESSKFHIYEMIWTNSSIQFFVDEVMHHSVSYDPNTPFDKYFFIILNVAMGGTFTGHNIDPNFTSSALEVDYIRVYQ